MRKVCVVVGSRANYSSIKSAMRAIAGHPELELQLVVGASALLDRYGTVEDLIEQDGFEPDERVFMLIEGETPATMAKSTGLGLLELPTAFERLQPDVVITVGDRFETMATALAATYMNIPLAHTMGGEVSGNIDETIRHAVTKFAHVHFPASQGARTASSSWARTPSRSTSSAARAWTSSPRSSREDGDGLSELFDTGVGGRFSLDEPFLLVSQHPVTTEYGDGERQINETLAALQDVGCPRSCSGRTPTPAPSTSPRDAQVARAQRRLERALLQEPADERLHQADGEDARALVGNSSSAIREGAFIGTPAVNIGPRQDGRERGSNVDRRRLRPRRRSPERSARRSSTAATSREPIYGDGTAGRQIADILAERELSIHKRMTY